MTRGSRRTQRWKPANNAAGKVARSLRRGSSVFVRPPGDPSPDGPLQLRVEFGDAILDGEPFGPTAVDELPPGHSQFPGEFLHLDPLLGHGPIPALQGHRVTVRFGLCVSWPARPLPARRDSPPMRFVFLQPKPRLVHAPALVAFTLPTTPRDDAVAVQLAMPTTGASRGLAPRSHTPCPAHHENTADGLRRRCP